ncbi:MAG: CBS domain-containing protein [Deltaproteobacteria bacterium]|nr:CBS domain-containing protein [Deltaproteobacteria bacterium]
MTAISHYMTEQPWALQIDDSVAVARQMFAERQIHHLPVLDGRELVGMVVARDLALAAHRLETVEKVMTAAHAVHADTSLEHVLDEMRQHGRDAVVIVDDQKVLGIFTAMDAVRVLHDIVRRLAA